jgi:hypothetical protein
MMGLKVCSSLLLTNLKGWFTSFVDEKALEDGIADDFVSVRHVEDFFVMTEETFSLGDDDIDISERFSEFDLISLVAEERVSESISKGMRHFDNNPLGAWM